ncbi:DNA binding domain protein, excisionase family [Caldicellulosiruptor owensensis OL]|uniref:DNA binding domain protein, excisionase family n=1 Tax=Caldicellulosiruptor owensensis (strain ATCC 700167 / DSM 13100 / OL) TaxID=632518 RepID=E4Q606_CALOW|nr:helix-turn-helix domain-containing protein [Caldicellulosiruptor owensensis]ADQ04380.1 DNA binding domain protein, excisionase family [Caldicellulosiruptor owensensis OL]
MDNKKAYTVQEAAKILSLGKTTVYELIRQNKIKCIYIGKKIIIPQKAIDEFIEQNMTTCKESERFEPKITYQPNAKLLSIKKISL